MTDLENALAFQLDAARIPYQREVHAVKSRRYRWDFQVGDYLIEVQGGTWSRKRTGHSTGMGIRRDAEKANTAALAGYRTLFFTSDMIADGTALNTIAEIGTADAKHD